MRITIDRNTILPSDLKLSDEGYEGHEVCITDAEAEVSTRFVGYNLQSLANLLIETGIVIQPEDRGSYNKMEAIKRVRALFGVDLRTAKEFVDRFVPPTI